MSQTTTLPKPHYAILDGLRGVAAVMVVAFHVFEVHSTSHFDQIINHGYLAVDFFFVLSGFVVGYAYDDRWNRMSLLDFFKIRLIRLQPMVVMGMILGALCFYFQDSSVWPGIHEVPVWKLLLVMLIGATLIPLPISMDIRGWQEMHPLNGPGWSLFFEYVVNILYGLFIRKFSNTALSILVFLAGAVLIHYAVTIPGGDMVGGWSLDPTQLRTGFTRVMYPFFAGLLLSRISNLRPVKHAFLWCSLLLILVFALPRMGDQEHVWINGLYESCCILFVFPLIVYMGASGISSNTAVDRISKFLGEISYPIYMTHFPLIYIYTGWVSDHKGIGFQGAWPVALGLFVSSIAIAYASLKWFDEPVRRWLKKRFMAPISLK